MTSVLSQAKEEISQLKDSSRKAAREAEVEDLRQFVSKIEIERDSLKQQLQRVQSEKDQMDNIEKDRDQDWNRLRRENYELKLELDQKKEIVIFFFIKGIKNRKQVQKFRREKHRRIK